MSKEEITLWRPLMATNVVPLNPVVVGLFLFPFLQVGLLVVSWQRSKLFNL